MYVCVCIKCQKRPDTFSGKRDLLLNAKETCDFGLGAVGGEEDVVRLCVCVCVCVCCVCCVLCVCVCVCV
jgi:hypothetical protein